MDKQSDKLEITIQNSRPVELFDLTYSFLGFADEYKRMISLQGDAFAAREVRLYVQEIRSGSIIADLVALAPFALPLMDNANTIIDFGKYLGDGFSNLLGKTEEKIRLSKASLENFSRIVAPIARDNGSQLNIQPVIETINIQNQTININCTEANAIQNIVRQEIERLSEPSTGLHENVVLYWYQTRNDARSQAGDRAVIESIHPGPVRTIFNREVIKAEILQEESNIFKYGYIGDVQVETVRGIPVLYKITAIHGRVDLPGSNSEKNR